MNVTRTVVVLSVALASGLAAACSPGSTTGGQQNGGLVNGKTFTMALSGDPGNLDPSMSVLVPQSQMSNLMYDNLLAQKSSGDLQPWLAKSWRGNSTRVSFTLRSGVTCSDGSPLKASDVAADLNFIADPKNHSPYLGLLVVPGVKATADDATGTIDVTSSKPDSFLARNLGSIPIVCGKGRKNRSLLARGSDGTGLFVLTRAQPNNEYVLTRRKDYAWGPGKWRARQSGLPDRIVVRIVSNEGTASNLLISHQINAATIRGSERQRLERDGFSHRDYLLPPGVIVFNEAAAHPTSDPAVRKALVQAADLTKVGKVMTNGRGKKSTGVVAIEPAVCTGNAVAGSLPSFDAKAAESRLDAAGWKVGSGGVRTKDGKPLKITFTYPSADNQVAAGAELLQQQWRSVGVDVSVKGLDSAGLGRVLQGAVPWDVGLAPFQFNLPSNLVPFVSGATPPSGINFTHVENPDYQKLVGQAQKLADKSSCAKWESAERALIKRSDLVPFVNSVNSVFLYGASVELDRGLIVGTSIRMHATE